MLRPTSVWCVPIFFLVLAAEYPSLCEVYEAAPEIGKAPDDDGHGHKIQCGMAGDPNACCIDGRFCFARTALENRGAGDVAGHPMIEIAVGEGFGKLVVKARDTASAEDVFLKCKPPEGGAGEVVGVRSWRGEEVEEALAAHPHVLTRTFRLGMSNGGVCSVYPLASHSLSDAIAQGSLSPSETLHALLEVLEGLAGMHSAGFVHRDLKHRNILAVAQHQPAAPAGSAARARRWKWMLADVDASARPGDHVWELMGYPWHVWVPSIQIGAWPSAVPSPEHARHLHMRWAAAAASSSSSSAKTSLPPLSATTQHDVFQFGVLVFEAICRASVLAGRPGRAVLADLGAPSPLPLPLPACQAAPAWAAHAAALEAALGVAARLMSKDPSARAALDDVRASLLDVLAQVSGEASARESQARARESTATGPAAPAPRCADVDFCFNIKV